MFGVRKEHVWIVLLCAAVSGAIVCQVPDESRENLFDGSSGNNTSEHREEASGGDLFTCPGAHDPTNYTACCYSDEVNSEGESVGGPRCCAPASPPVGIFYISDQLAMIIALTVTTVCVIITIIIIVCCFWSRCPLYTACRIRYHQDDIIAYASKDEEMTGLNDMPPEETKGVTIYSPNAVKVTLKDDV